MAAKRRGLRVTPDATISDIDLDEEEFILEDGTRLTDGKAAEIVEQVLKSGRGRPSLTGASEKSPHLNLRVAPALKGRLQERADREGKKVSDVVREVLESHV